MQIILIDKVNKLGILGDEIKVKSGYARNFLIPKGKAILATKKNIESIKNRIKELNYSLQKYIDKAKDKAKKINKIKEITIFAKVGKKEKLFGSINRQIITDTINKNYDINIKRNEINLKNGAIRTIGKHVVKLKFHREISTSIILNIKKEEK